MTTTMQRRKVADVEAAEHERFERVWYERHMVLHDHDDTRCPTPGNAGCEPAEKIRQAYGAINRLSERVPDGAAWGPVGPYDDFDWGRLCGQLEALRWLLGSDWGDLDT